MPIVLWLALALYLICYFWFRRKRKPVKWLVDFLHYGALTVALTSLVALLVTVFVSPRWPESAQIAWTGLETTETSLQVGGNPETAIVGWPNGSFAPSINVKAKGGDLAAIQMSEGSGFVFDESAWRFLNGEALPIDQKNQIGEFVFQVTKTLFGNRRVEIFKGSKNLADFTMESENRAYPLVAFIEKSIARRSSESLWSLVGIGSKSSEDLSQEWFDLQCWAASVRILLTQEGEVRLLRREQSIEEVCAFPCRLTIFWTTLRLPLVIRREKAKLKMEFPPPWRLVSSIPQWFDGEPPSKAESAFAITPTAMAQAKPPAKKKSTPSKNTAPSKGNATAQTDSQADGKRLTLTVTNRLEPNDVAFLMPFGQGNPDPRGKLTLIKRDRAETILQKVEGVQEDDLSDLPPEVLKQRKTEVYGKTSETLIRSGSYAFLFATVHDLPGLKKLIAPALFAFVSFAAGLFLLRPRRQEIERLRDSEWPLETEWLMIYGIALVVWDFLAFRLLLALRYALADPSRLDRHAVTGVVIALTALAVLPGLLLLLCRLRRDYFVRPPEELRKRLKWFALSYLLFLGLAFVVEYGSAPRLWENLPERFAPSLGFWFTGLLLGLLVYFALAIMFIYAPNSQGLPVFRSLLVSPWGFLFENMANRWSRIWQRYINRSQEGLSWRDQLINMAAVLFFVGVYFALVPLLLSATLGLLPIKKFYQEVIAPLMLCWFVVVGWIVLKRLLMSAEGLGSSGKPPWLRVFFWAAVTILPPVFLMPVLISDVGSIMGALSIFITLVLLLLASKPRRLGVAVLTALLFGFALASFAYIEIPSLFGQAESRMLTFREESAIQNRLLFTSAVSDTDLFASPVQKLRNAYQHIWENKAIAHEGGWLGKPFCMAPTDRSQIRQDTLQFDSVFSFYVLSENGIIGGFFLLLLYAMPLIIVLFSARNRFDMGKAVATIIASAFFLEGMIHAAMNLNALPFTGRDLPLLAVKSSSDLLRWTILFLFAAITAFWKYDQTGKEYEVNDDERDTEIDKSSSIISASLKSSLPEERRSYGKALVIILALPLLMIGYVTWKGVAITLDASLEKSFGWDVLLRDVSRIAKSGALKADAKAKILPPDPSQLKTSEDMLIEQEIKRFNALPDEERDRESHIKAGLAEFNNVNNWDSYDKYLQNARGKSFSEAGDLRPSIFRLRRVTELDDTGKVISSEYQVEPNPDFNIRLNFRAGNKKEDVPTLRFRGRQEIIIGPAWAKGRWVMAVNPNAPLPWAANLAAVINEEVVRLDSVKEVERLYGELSLDRELQEAAMNFSGQKGRDLYGSLLAQLSSTPASPKSQPSSKAVKIDERRLPPQVALCVLSLPKGETLALGGWPRSSNNRFWQLQNNEWLPPVSWLENDSPLALRLRYEGDRNFTTIVMGSATKPLWATAVLAIHPNLNQRLMVTGSSQSERSLFGVDITRDDERYPDWQVTPRARWMDFNDYLTFSDNRYHVRVGFLGLAEREGNDIKTDGGANSAQESMDSGKSVWGKFPRFPSLIHFSKQTPSVLANLEQTSLAEHLRRMYAIDVIKGISRHRTSFWTKDESDNLLDTELASPRQDSPTALFRWISPLAPNFELDHLDRPRDYISLLLGGKGNRWANIDFAAAFATCITGKPVIEHVVVNDKKIEPLPDREVFVERSRAVLQGLKQVLKSGTAKEYFSPDTIAFLDSLDVQIYAKTGTLSEDKGTQDTSRIVLAMVKWANTEGGTVRDGLVFSVVGERAQKGTAARWLNEFIAANKEKIRQLLSDGK
jgi:cell division protein FtsW (lipid II flippase)